MRRKTTFKRGPDPVEVTTTCPKCGKVWNKLIPVDILDEEIIEIVSQPVQFCKDCRKCKPDFLKGDFYD